MYRLIMLAALMLSVVGGLAVMLGSSSVAAQTANRAAPSTVAPGETFTVTISVADYGDLAGILTETLPAGFEYVDSEHGGGRGHGSGGRGSP